MQYLLGVSKIDRTAATLIQGMSNPSTCTADAFCFFTKIVLFVYTYMSELLDEMDVSPYKIYKK